MPERARMYGVRPTGEHVIDITLDAPVQYHVILVDGVSDAPPDAAMDVYLDAARAANARIIHVSADRRALSRSRRRVFAKKLFGFFQTLRQSHQRGRSFPASRVSQSFPRSLPYEQDLPVLQYSIRPCPEGPNPTLHRVVRHLVDEAADPRARHEPPVVMGVTEDELPAGAVVLGTASKDPPPPPPPSPAASRNTRHVSRVAELTRDADGSRAPGWPSAATPDRVPGATPCHPSTNRPRHSSSVPRDTSISASSDHPGCAGCPRRARESGLLRLPTRAGQGPRRGSGDP